jgi:hypothetical protein
MELFIAGGVHEDPLGRRKIEGWLKRIQEDKGEPPAFVAVEWDLDIFRRVEATRNSLRQRVQSEWPDFTVEFWECLSHTLAYEADAHRSVVPDLEETLWLDQGRQVSDRVIAASAGYYLDKWKEWLGGQSYSDARIALGRLEEMAWRKAAPPTPPHERRPDEIERDVKWVRLLRHRIAQGGGTWAFVSVGVAHTVRLPSYARYLLESSDKEDKQACNVLVLSPIPWPPSDAWPPSDDPTLLDISL